MNTTNKKGSYCCPECGNTQKFYTTAHVMQEWLVDGYGDFLEVSEPCLEVTHKPDKDNIWTCAECGAEAIILE